MNGGNRSLQGVFVLVFYSGNIGSVRFFSRTPYVFQFISRLVSVLV